MSDSVWAHTRQPTRLPRPWDSPGKNTGVGCHFLLQCMKVKSESEVAESRTTLSDTMQPTRFLRPWDFPGKSTGVGCQCSLYQNLRWILAEINKLILKFIEKFKRPRIAKAILKKKKAELEDSPFLISRLNTKLKYSRQWFWHKDRHINFWNRIDRLEINSYIYGNLFLTVMPRQFIGR